MRALIASLVIAAAFAGSAHASTPDVFRRLNESAPLHDVLERINETAPHTGADRAP